MESASFLILMLCLASVSSVTVLNIPAGSTEDAELESTAAPTTTRTSLPVTEVPVLPTSTTCPVHCRRPTQKELQTARGDQQNSNQGPQRGPGGGPGQQGFPGQQQQFYGPNQQQGGQQGGQQGQFSGPNQQQGFPGQQQQFYEPTQQQGQQGQFSGPNQQQQQQVNQNQNGGNQGQEQQSQSGTVDIEEEPPAGAIIDGPDATDVAAVAPPLLAGPVAPLVGPPVGPGPFLGAPFPPFYGPHFFRGPFGRWKRAISGGAQQSQRFWICEKVCPAQ